MLNHILGGPKDKISDFYKALVEPDLIPWAIVLAPYIGFQLVRSVIWAIRTLRAEGKRSSAA